MSEDHGHEHPHAAPQPVFRFEAFADAACAQAAFDTIYPAGSSIETAAQALVDLGALCKTLGPNRVACRYLENGHALAGWCWHVALDAGAGKTIERSRIQLTAIGP